MDLREYVKMRFAEHCDEVHAFAGDVTREDWRVDDDPYCRFGYRRPLERSVIFCSELMSEQMSRAPLHIQGAYLDAVLYQMDFYLAYPDLDGDEASVLLDRQLANEALGSLHILNTIQAQALDSQLS